MFCHFLAKNDAAEAAKHAAIIEGIVLITAVISVSSNVVAFSARTQVIHPSTPAMINAFISASAMSVFPDALVVT